MKINIMKRKGKVMHAVFFVSTIKIARKHEKVYNFKII